MSEKAKSDQKLCIRKITEKLNHFIEASKTQQIFLSQTDLIDIDELKDSVQELENDRFKAHEIWEIESIKTDSLRNKLKTFPSEISDEIQRAIKAARGMNEETIMNLRERLKKIDTNIDKYSYFLDQYNQENEKLIPRLEHMKLKHEEIVVLLNQHLSLKADKQIDLNEIRNEIHNDNEQIVALEEAMFSLKQDLIKERAEARQQKHQLTNETNETQERLNAQKTVNADLNKVYNDLKHEASETTNVLNDKITILRKQVKTIGEMKIRLKQVEDNIETTMSENSQMKADTLKCEDEIAESRVNFENWKNQAEESSETINESVKMNKQIHSELLTVKAQATEELELSNRSKDKISQKVRSLLDKLKEVEETSASKAGDVGLMEYEMEEMEKEMIDTKNNHEATVAIMARQTDNLKKQLDKERKERNEVQNANSSLQDEINQWRGKHVKLIRELNAGINEAKSEHSRITNQMVRLQNEATLCRAEAGRIEKELPEMQSRWTAEEKELESRVTMLTRETLHMEADESERQLRLGEMEPRFVELQHYYERTKKEYEMLKRNLVALKSRKSGIDDGIMRFKRDIDKEKRNMEALRHKKTEKTESLDSQLEREADERDMLEKKIYMDTCHISTLQEEITKMETFIAKLEKRIANLREFWEQAIHNGRRIKEDINTQRDDLARGWVCDSELVAEFQQSETAEIERLKTLLHNTDERQHLIAEISHKLLAEIDHFDHFLLSLGTVDDSHDEKQKKDKKIVGTAAKLKTLSNALKKFKTDD